MSGWEECWYLTLIKVKVPEDLSCKVWPTFLLTALKDSFEGSLALGLPCACSHSSARKSLPATLPQQIDSKVSIRGGAHTEAVSSQSYVSLEVAKPLMWSLIKKLCWWIPKFPRLALPPGVIARSIQEVVKKACAEMEKKLNSDVNFGVRMCTAQPPTCSWFPVPHLIKWLGWVHSEAWSTLPTQTCYV